MAKKKYDDRDKAVFKNIFPWAVGFDKINSIGDVLVDAYEIVRRVNVEEVQSQIDSQNFGFVGVDGYGLHAAFQFTDLGLYNFLFGTNAEKLPEYLTEEDIIDLLKNDNREEYEAILDKLILSKGDARFVARIINTEEAAKTFAPWKYDVIRKRIDHVLTNGIRYKVPIAKEG